MCSRIAGLMGAVTIMRVYGASDDCWLIQESIGYTELVVATRCGHHGPTSVM